MAVVRETTNEKIGQDAYMMTSCQVEALSSVYKKSLSVSNFLVEKTSNTVGRLTGVSYTAKTLHAVLGGFKNVKTADVHEILLNNKLSFGEKIKESVNLMREGYSHEATVAAVLWLKKEALVVAPIAGSIGMLIAAAAPVAAIAAAAVAGTCIMKAATYYLATDAGHKLESGMAKALESRGMDPTTGKVAAKVKAGLQFLTSFRKAGKGQDPEMNNVCDVADNMEKLAHAHGGHEHGHADHHKTFKEEFKQDMNNVKKAVVMLAASCVMLWNRNASAQQQVSFQQETQIATAIAPEKPKGSAFVVTGAALKAAAEKENKLAQSPPKQKPPAMKM